MADGNAALSGAEELPKLPPICIQGHSTGKGRVAMV